MARQCLQVFAVRVSAMCRCRNGWMFANDGRRVAFLPRLLCLYSHEEFHRGERCFAGRWSEPVAQDGVHSALRAACTLPAPCLRPPEGGGPRSPGAEPVSDATCSRSLPGIGGVPKPLFVTSQVISSQATVEIRTCRCKFL